MVKKGAEDILFQTSFNLKLEDQNEKQQILIRLFSSAAAEGLRLQRGIELGIEPVIKSEKKTARGLTGLAHLQTSELTGLLLTHIIDAERELGHFDHLCRQSVHYYNKDHTGSGRIKFFFLKNFNYRYSLSYQKFLSMNSAKNFVTGVSVSLIFVINSHKLFICQFLSKVNPKIF